MPNQDSKFRIALLGGGPSSLFVLKKLLGTKTHIEVDIFERNKEIGPGMPYSEDGANLEHVTNVSDNEIPKIARSIASYVGHVTDKKRALYGVNEDNFSRFKVLPRLFFGQYLSDQFKLLQKKAQKTGITVRTHTGLQVTDVVDRPEDSTVEVLLEDGRAFTFHAVVICTGHNWVKTYEDKIPGFYDSPYPPSKLELPINHAVALKGSSLTAIDAIRTLARANGKFVKKEDEKLVFIPAKGSEKFKIVMHSRNGLLPAVRFHLRQPRLSKESLLSKRQIDNNKKKNGGFLSLDYVFEENFKKGFKDSDAKFYKRIKDMSLEDFVDEMMSMRQDKDPFQLFREEYAEAERSIENEKSIFWKEMLAELSFIINYPAKYFSAEDMMRLKQVLMPLMSLVIAFAPQKSCEELFALHDAGRLDIISVGSDSEIIPHPEGGVYFKYVDEQGKNHKKRFHTYVDCAGQRALSVQDLPFPSLLKKRVVSQATLKFKSMEAGRNLLEEGDDQVIQNSAGDYFYIVPGIAINDHFQIVNEYGMSNDRLYIMAVPYISGYNPDYSGLDFSEQAANQIVEKMDEVLGQQELQASV